jgi:hypothetical protein
MFRGRPRICHSGEVSRPPNIAALLARDGTPFVVVRVEPSAQQDLPARFTAEVRAADDTTLGVFDAVREVGGASGTWIVTGLDERLDAFEEGAAIVLAAPDGLELRGQVTVISSGAPGPSPPGA